jgi:DNA-binding protein H-NS
MADEKTEQSPQPQEGQEPAAGGLAKKLAARKTDPLVQRQKPPDQGVAHIPATVLTVEYVDDSDGMDAALRTMSERLQKLEGQVNALHETQTQLIAAVNQQAKSIGKYVESVGRRIDRLYRRMAGSDTASGRQAGPAPVEEDTPPEEDEGTEQPATLTGTAGVSADVADDPDHQNAWRIARVLAADLEAYHEAAVKEGVLYGTFYKLLKEPIEKARQTYVQRVPEAIVANYDYFSRALDELIARKRMELEQEQGE